jgi:hypothetical protein
VQPRGPYVITYECQSRRAELVPAIRENPE